MRMTVADLMSNCFVKVSPECSIDMALYKLERHSVSELYVSDSAGRLLGVLPDYEIIKAQLSGESSGTTAEQLMSRAIPVFKPASDAAEVARMFREAHFHQFPVVQSGKLVGVIRRADIVKLMAILRRMDAPSKTMGKPAVKAPKLLSPVVRTRRSHPVAKSSASRSKFRTAASRKSKAR